MLQEELLNVSEDIAELEETNAETLSEY